MPLVKISKTYQAILIIVTGLLFLYWSTKLQWLLYAAGAVSLLSLMSKDLADKIYWLWMKLAWVLSLFMPKILLTIIFFVVLWPIALLAKLFGRKDPLALREPKTTNFITVQKEYKSSDLENMW